MTGASWSNTGLQILMHRGMEASPSESRIQKFKIGANAFADPTTADTGLDKPIAPADADRTTIDSMDAVTGWSNSTDATVEVLNTTTKQEGTGALDIGKSGVASTDAFYTKTVSSFDISTTPGYLYYWFRVADTATRDKLQTRANGGVRLLISDDGFTSFEGWKSDGNDTLQTGFNLIFADPATTPDFTSGTVDQTAITDVRVQFVTNNAADVITSGDLIMDFYHRSTKASTLINVESGFPTFDDNNIKSTNRGIVGFTQANGYSINEFAMFNNDVTPLMATRDRTAAFSKTSKVKLVLEQVDQYQDGT